MKTVNRWIRYQLLKDSGELSLWKRWTLKRAMQRDPALRAWRAWADALQTSARSCRTDHALEDATREYIQTEAARAVRPQSLRAGAIRRWSRVPGWRPAIIYGCLSLLLMIAAVMLSPSRPGRWAEQPPGILSVESGPEEWDAVLLSGDFEELDWLLTVLQDDLEEWVWLADDRYVEQWAVDLLEWEDS